MKKSSVTPAASLTVASGVLNIMDIIHDGTDLWVSGGYDKKLFRIDPSSLTVTSTYTHATDEIHILLSAFGSIWTTTAYYAQVLRFDPTTFPAGDSLISTLAPSGVFGITSLTSDGTYLWAAARNSTNDLFRFSTGIGTEAVVAQLALTGEVHDGSWPKQIAFADSSIWMTALLFNIGVADDSEGVYQFSTGVGTEAQTAHLRTATLWEYGPPVVTDLTHVTTNLTFVTEGSGTVEVNTSDRDDSTASVSIDINTGAVTNGGNSGSISIDTGAASGTVTSGTVTISTGNVDGGGDSGAVSIATGNSDGNSGNLSLDVGGATNTYGGIYVGAGNAREVLFGNAAAVMGAFGSPGTTLPTVTGSTGGNVALQSLIAALAALGWIVDDSS